MDITSPITGIKGIGEKTQKSFAKMGVYTVGDILLHFPRNYVKFPEITDIDELNSVNESQDYAIHAVIRKAPLVKNTGRMQITLQDIGSPGHMIQLIWYRMPYLKAQLSQGRHLIFYGRIKPKGGKYVMEQPVVYEVEKYEAIRDTLQPVYSITSGITNNLIVKTVKEALANDRLLGDYLPPKIRGAYGFCEYNYAMKQIHFPDDFDALIEARHRLVFDEFFLFIMGMRYQNKKQQKDRNSFLFTEPQFVDELIEKLPYELTNAQKNTIREIENDMQSPYVMQRLIQGDVGSGKTIVAFLLMAWASKCGYQSAIMAPTEVLANQHYETFCSLVEQFGLDCPVILLTGSMTVKQKRMAYERMKTEKNALIIGTHALIQEKADFENLSLVITDEQHRFGVKQRETFSDKGTKPHILVMSATPIPRTLAIIIYGDMDISVINEVPAKRLPIKNCVVNTAYRPKAYSFIEDQVKKGHQAYVICPLVEETENSEGENVTDYAVRLREALPDDIKVDMLNGKMKSKLKDEVMTRFAKNESQVLVSTTVVEVGVNVPNATVMMIENADRFGLAQLHQLRGRVGRGDAQSYCIFINSSNSKKAQKRLEILNKSNDGFYIASEDLKLRGPGDFFGIRQSGDLAFTLADVYQDSDVLKEASEMVDEVLKEDPELALEEHHLLKKKMEQFAKEQLKRMNL
ncbi:ATP-dependent DNA helicase RecG [Agathobacter sp.]